MKRGVAGGRGIIDHLRKINLLVSGHQPANLNIVFDAERINRFMPIRLLPAQGGSHREQPTSRKPFPRYAWMPDGVPGQPPGSIKKHRRIGVCAESPLNYRGSVIKMKSAPLSCR